MKPYEFGLAGRPWPDRASFLHVYAPIDLAANPELAEVISRWREAIASDPIRLLPDPALHITIEAITDTPAARISTAERRELANAVRAAVSGAPPYTGLAAGCLSTSSGAVVNISPAEPLAALHRRIRAAVQATRGADATTADISKAHISLGYCYRQVDSDLVQRHLRAVDPSHAPVAINELRLVDVHADKDSGGLTWDTVEIIPLG
ncbi:2'-5' RNA ligase family protein [Nocardia miyunensis]|uniref:2'-5' RNA ligase family protein n=1 Tax=Nocardia miyunensis TaxID=282684 RepID=UPI00082A14F4|nr:2'-5' RNA ligase family protein [Nocardia miyunensis]